MLERVFSYLRTLEGSLGSLVAMQTTGRVSYLLERFHGRYTPRADSEKMYPDEKITAGPSTAQLAKTRVAPLRMTLLFGVHQSWNRSSCEVSTGCPFDLSARSWLCDQTAFPERSNGLSPECPTDGSQSRAVSEKSS